jgi:hypothetical protein
MDAPSVERSAGGEAAVLPADVGADERRARAVLSAAVTLYFAALAGLHAAGVFGAFFKCAAVPTLFVIAYLLRRFSSFAREYALFLCTVVMFDNTRGLVYGLTLHFQRPVYMGYALEYERALFGSPIPSSWLQHALSNHGRISALQKAMVVLHASHFLVFLFVGMLLWLSRPCAFARFRVALLAVMGLGIVGYALVPTVPPWMASTQFGVLEPLTHVPEQLYHSAVPTMTSAFDLNPIAAMPSLHAAFPTLLTLVCFEAFGAWGFLMGAYTLLMWFTIVALGEHYIVDVMAGITLALVVWTLTHRVPAIARWLDARCEAPELRPARETPWQGVVRLWRPLAIAVGLLVVAQGVDMTARALRRSDLPTEDFIQRELVGKSPLADYYRGLVAYEARDYPVAQRYLQNALAAVPDAPRREQAALLLGQSAFRSGDYRTAVDVLGAQPKLDAEQALMLTEGRQRLAAAVR